MACVGFASVVLPCVALGLFVVGCCWFGFGVVVVGCCAGGCGASSVEAKANAVAFAQFSTMQSHQH